MMAVGAPPRQVTQLAGYTAGSPITVCLALHLAPVGNRRESIHFERARRVRREIKATILALRPWLREARPELPLTIEIERIGWNALDSDGLVGCAKSVRDAIAHWYEVNDRDPRLHFHLSQSLTRETRIVRHRGRKAASCVWITVRAWVPSDGGDPLRVLAAGSEAKYADGLDAEASNATGAQ